MIPQKTLQDRQSWSLDKKIQEAGRRIVEWYEAWDGKVYVAFSGGKDSRVTLEIVRNLYPDIPAVYVNTGLEFPEINTFVKTIPNVIQLRPAMPFHKVIEKYGYPVISKDQATALARYRKTKDPQQKYYRLNGYPNGKKGMISKKWQFLIDAPFKIDSRCCDIMKKTPLHKYQKESGRQPITGMMADESNMRTLQYLKQGCNAFGLKNPTSAPISFWLEEDIYAYIEKYNIPYSKIYDMGYRRTGCMFCMFGVNREQRIEGTNRFLKMEKTHPKQHKYCIEKLKIGTVLDFIGIPYTEKQVTQKLTQTNMF